LASIRERLDDDGRATGTPLRWSGSSRGARRSVLLWLVLYRVLYPRVGVDHPRLHLPLLSIGLSDDFGPRPTLNPEGGHSPIVFLPFQCPQALIVFW